MRTADLAHFNVFSYTIHRVTNKKYKTSYLMCYICQIKQGAFSDPMQCYLG